jgi:hypothetical protein
MYYQPKGTITMTQSINSTIVSALHSAGVSEYSQQSYSTYVAAVEKALTEREHQITDELLSIADQYGSFDRDDVKNELATRTGLTFRPEPEPEVEAPAAEEEDVTGESSEGKKKGKNGKRIDALEEKLDTLSASVSQLVTLAQRHLGASI